LKPAITFFSCFLVNLDGRQQELAAQRKDLRKHKDEEELERVRLEKRIRAAERRELRAKIARELCGCVLLLCQPGKAAKGCCRLLKSQAARRRCCSVKNCCSSCAKLWNLYKQ